MRKISSQIVLSLIFSISITSCVMTSDNSNSIKPDYDKLEAEVRNIFPYSLALFKKKDLDGLVDRFTKNATLKNPNTPITVGIEAIRESYKGALKLEGFKLELNIIKVDISEAGDMAYTLLEFFSSYQTSNGSSHNSGTSLIVLKRVDNVWKIAAETMSATPILK